VRMTGSPIGTAPVCGIPVTPSCFARPRYDRRSREGKPHRHEQVEHDKADDMMGAEESGVESRRERRELEGLGNEGKIGRNKDTADVGSRILQRVRTPSFLQNSHSYSCRTGTLPVPCRWRKRVSAEPVTHLSGNQGVALFNAEISALKFGCDDYGLGAVLHAQ